MQLRVNWQKMNSFAMHVTRSEGLSPLHASEETVTHFSTRYSTVRETTGLRDGQNASSHMKDPQRI